MKIDFQRDFGGKEESTKSSKKTMTTTKKKKKKKKTSNETERRREERVRAKEDVSMTHTQTRADSSVRSVHVH